MQLSVICRAILTIAPKIAGAAVSGRRHTAGHIESNEPDDRRQNRDGGRCRGHDRQCPNRERTFPGHVPSADARHFQWQSEISRPTNRGILLTIQSANINSGFVLSTWITFGTAYVTRSHFQWIFPIALQVVFPIYLLAIVPFLVESPRWVARHRSLDQATQVIARIWDLPADHEEVKQLRYEIEMAMEAEKVRFLLGSVQKRGTAEPTAHVVGRGGP